MPADPRTASASRYAGRTPLGPDDLEWETVDGEQIPVRLTDEALMIIVMEQEERNNGDILGSV